MEGREFQKNNLRLRSGDHVSVLHEGAVNGIVLLLRLLYAGLADNAKCLYVVEDFKPLYVNQDLCWWFLKPVYPLRPGKLAFIPCRDFLGEGTFFEPDKVLTRLAVHEHKAVKEGYSGLRVVMEMTSFASHTELELLLDYEKKLNAYCRESRCAIACAYDLLRIPSVTLLNTFVAHPLVLLDGALCKNIYNIPNPDIRLDSRASETILRHYLQQLRDCTPYLNPDPVNEVIGDDS